MYNKPQIMKQSHELYRAGGLTQSEALRKSWAMAKIEKMESAKFDLDMKDRWTQADKAESRCLAGEIARLRGITTKRQPIDRKAAERKLFENLGFVWSDEENAWMPVAA